MSEDSKSIQSPPLMDDHVFKRPGPFRPKKSIGQIIRAMALRRIRQQKSSHDLFEQTIKRKRIIMLMRSEPCYKGLLKAIKDMEVKGLTKDSRYSQLLSIRSMFHQENSLNYQKWKNNINQDTTSLKSTSGSIPDAEVKNFNFTPKQLIQLKAAVLGFKYLSRNEALPTHVRMAILGKKLRRRNMFKNPDCVQPDDLKHD